MNSEKPFNDQLPEWPEKLLRRICNPIYLEEIVGDLKEEFEYQLAKKGKAAARWDYIHSALSFSVMYLIKGKTIKLSSINYLDMLNHYLTFVWRNWKRNKVISFIKIFGLTTGLLSFLLIFLWVQKELSVDRFHKSKEQLYIVHRYINNNGEQQAGPFTPALLATELKTQFPEVQYASGFGFISAQPETFRAGEKIQKMQGFRAGEDFFKMFSYPLIEGTVDLALKDPGSIAISRQMAEVFFGSASEAMGKEIRFNNRSNFTVHSVFENLPDDSSHRFDYLINWRAHLNEYEFLRNGWNNFFHHTYIQLYPEADLSVLEQKTTKFLDQYLQQSREGVSQGLTFQKYGEGYLYAKYVNGKFSGGRIENVIIFSTVAIFILLISCINFINLSTAQASTRAKEIGIRKSAGSGFYKLFWQFITESMVYAFGAGFFSLLILFFIVPVINNHISLNITVPYQNLYYGVAFFGVILLCGLLAGLYPALFLSSLSPVDALKEKMRFGVSAVVFRKALVIFQFSVSILLLIVTFVISEQIFYLQSKDLGYEKENLIFIPLEGDLGKQAHVLMEEALKVPGVKFAAKSTQPPHTFTNVIGNVTWEGKDPGKSVLFQPAKVGYDYLTLMGLELTQGRDFSLEFSMDSTAFIVNEEAVRKMELEEPINHTVTAFGINGRIIGVLKDYHTQSFRLPHYPLILSLDDKITQGFAFFRIETGRTSEVLSSLENLCQSLNPDSPFTYKFADEEYEKQYRNEVLVAKLSKSFSLVAGFISLLGLWGLAMFASTQRAKEMGIRKVLGATIANLLFLLSNSFLRLVLLSILIATPIAGYIMKNWLNEFAFRVELSWWMFGLPCVAVLLVALLTVSGQSMKLVSMNPVRFLRSE